MRLEMGGTDHQLICAAAPGREFGQNAVEHTRPTPANEPVVVRLVQTIGGRHSQHSPLRITNKIPLSHLLICL